MSSADPFTITSSGSAAFEADFGSYNSSTQSRPSMPMKKGSTEGSNITLSTVSTAGMGSSMHLSVDSSAFNETATVSSATVSSAGQASSERSTGEGEEKRRKSSKKKKSKKSSSSKSSSSSRGSKEKSSRKKRSSKDGSSTQEDHDAFIDSMMSPEQGARPSLAAQADDPFACFAPNPDPTTLNPFHDSFMPAKCEFGDFSDDGMDDWVDTVEDYRAQFDSGYDRRSQRSGFETAASESTSGSTREDASTSVDLSAMENMPRSQLDGGADMHDSFSVCSDLSGLTGVFESQGVDLTDEEEQAAEEPDVAPLAYPTRPQEQVKAAKESEKAARRASKPKRSVQFSTVESRYYERILGDNPSVLTGPPLGLGWRYRAFKGMDINKYEQKRGPTRPSSVLILPREERERRLSAVGVTKKEMATAIRANVRMRNKRRQTVQNLSVQNVEESVEGAAKTIKGLFGLKKK